MDHIDADTWGLAKMAIRADKHGWLPVTGGLLDQAGAFLEGMDFFLSDVETFSAGSK